MRLNDYLREDLILHRADVQDATSALATFSVPFEEGGYLSSRSLALEALTVRERSYPTCLANGVAVPHATVPDLEETLLLVATTKEPIPFGPPESDPVDLFFVLLSPPDREGEHIKLLARICRIVSYPDDLENLRGAADGDELLETIRRVDSDHV